MKATMPPRIKAHPWIALTLALVVLVGAGLGSYFGTRSDGASATASTTTTDTVSTGTVKQSVSATGTLAPAQDEELNFAVAGQVTAVAVKQGQKVTKGQVLARIDSASLSANLAQAKATVADDGAKVDNDESTGASDTQIAADNAALTAANNQLASATTQLAEATMTSPITGVVADLTLTVGQAVSGTGSSNGANSGSNPNNNSSSSNSDSTSSSSSTAQVHVISTDSWLVNATVDATSVDLIKNGDQAQLTVTGATDAVYGTIASIGLISSSSSGTAAFPVVVTVTGEPTGLHDGASVTAALIYRQVSNVIVVPTLALHRNASGGQYVEQLKNGKTVNTSVRVGIASGGQTQIVSGLSDGDKVLVPQLNVGNGNSGGNGRRGNFPSGVVIPGRGQFTGGNFPGGRVPVIGGQGG
jgi:multidrug efflux pump subunit AcrA (membrane-fusion protein)